MTSVSGSGDDVRRVRVTVHGRVQGVGFRYTVRREATSRGVAGSVENRSDGSVEAVFEGPSDAVGQMVELCRDGPLGARVTDVDESDEPPQGATGFDVR